MANNGKTIEKTKSKTKKQANLMRISTLTAAQLQISELSKHVAVVLQNVTKDLEQLEDETEAFE